MTGISGRTARWWRVSRAAAADVVFVCLGAPKQELWMVEHGPATGAHLMVGLGGSLDVFAGVVERAPEGFQKLGLSGSTAWSRNRSASDAWPSCLWCWSRRRAPGCGGSEHAGKSDCV